MKKFYPFVISLIIVVSFYSCSYFTSYDAAFVSKEKIGWINNDSIGYHTVLEDHRDSVEGRYCFILVVNFTSFEQVKFFKSIPSKQWLELLNNEETNWAANLCLYCLYRRDCASYVVNNIRSAKKWHETMQEKDDMDYWSRLLWDEIEKSDRK